MTTEALEARVARVEGIVGQMDSRLTAIESRLNQLDQKIDRLDGRLDGLRRELEAKIEQVGREATTNFRWLVALILPMWGSMIIAIVLKS